MLTILKPERRQNIFLNPSAEGSQGFAAVNGTAVQTDARAHWGRKSWLVTPTGAGCYLELDARAATNETHVMTIWASGGEPTEFRFGTGAARPWPVEFDGDWTRYEAVFTGSQVNGITKGRVYVNRATYLDDAQMEAGRVRSSTLNGGMGFGYRWLGAQNYSVSERFRYFKRRLVADGGLEKVLDDGERVRLSVAYGIGVPPVRIQSQERDTGDGELHLDKSLEPRAIRLTIWLVEDDPDALHELRAELIDLLSPKDEVKVICDLQGVRQSIVGAYQSGLELGEVFYSAEKITLNLMCPDSGWTALGQTVVDLTLASTLSTAYSTIRRSGEWSNLGSPGGAVRRYHETGDGTVYCGTLSDGSYGWVAVWNGSSWTQLAKVSGGSKAVYAVLRSFDGTQLYVVGSFTTIAKADGSGSTAAANLAVITLSTGAVAAIGSGLNGAGWALAWDPTGAILYVGGAFTSAGGTSANYIAKYTVASNTWAALGTGTDGIVYALATRRDGKVVAGGAFQMAGSSSSRVAGLVISNYGSGSLTGIVRWYTVVALNGATALARSSIVAATTANPGDSLSWTAYGGATSYAIYMLTLTGWAYVNITNGTTLVNSTNTGFTIGDGSENPPAITAMGTLDTPYVAAWNPTDSAWETVGVYGFNGTVYDLWLDHDGLTLFGVGAFKYADLNEANGVAWHNWAVWRSLGTGAAAGSTLYAVRRAPDGSVWVGGDAASFGGDTLAVYVGRWLGSLHSGAWVHTDLVLPNSTTVYALAEMSEDILLGHTASGTATRGAVTSIDWTGNLEGYPKVWVTGPGTLYGFGNFEAAADVLTEYTLVSGEEIVFDLGVDAKTVTSTLHRGVDYIVRPGSNLGDACLMPGDSNSFWFLMTGTDANSDAKIVGYPQYVSVDKPGAS